MPCGACRERLAKERRREVTLDPDHSVPFNVHAWSDSESVIELVDTLYASLPQKTLTSLVGTSNNKGSMSIKDIMRVVLVDQYSTFLEDPKLCTGFPRRNSDWVVSSRYNGQGIPRKIREVVDALVKHRYLRMIGGESTKSGGSQDIRSRIQPTKKLKDAFNKLVPEEVDVEPHRKRETIILRDKDHNDDKSSDIKYEDTPTTMRMRKVVEDYNEMMQRHHVDVASLRKPVFVRESVDAEGQPIMQRIRIGPKHMFTYRVFSRGDTKFKTHGRWYGGFWQQLPKKSQDLRKDIYIDGEPTDEIDFSGFHPTLLALKHGKLLKGDKYDLGQQVLDDLPVPEQRRVVKELVLIAINSKTKSAAFNAYNNQNKDKPISHNELGKLLATCIHKYPFLSSELCSDKGIELMYTDSQITEAAIRIFITDEKPVLPVHGSYIVKRLDRQYLKEVMQQACNEVLGYTPFESEFDEAMDHISHATHHKFTDQEYYSGVLKQHKTKVSKAYLKRYEDWLQRGQ